MPIIEKRIFKIDIANNILELIDPRNYGNDLDEYLNDLIKIILSEENSRHYKFQRNSTEIRGLITKYLADGDFGSLSLLTAQRLRTAEIEAQEKLNRLNKEIQKGLIIQILIGETNDTYKYVICKADDTEFLLEENYKKARGLPYKKKIFKAFVGEFDKNDHVNSVHVYDANNTKYWWKDFLELEEVFTDNYNTKEAFGSLDNDIFKKMKTKHPQDYIYLRNSTVKYFRSNDNFTLSHYIENEIENYTPVDPSLKIDALVKEIKELPEKRKFDQSFSIIKDEIKARFTNKIQLTSQIDLILKEDVPNINKIITAELGADGTKYVKIESEAGYKYFSRNNN